MPTIDLEQKRLDRLFDAIEVRFKVGSSLLEIPRIVHDMFEVTDIQKGRFELTHLFDDTVYKKVLVAKEIFLLLRVGDVFLLTMFETPHGWQILDMSPPYEDGTFDE